MDNGEESRSRIVLGGFVLLIYFLVIVLIEVRIYLIYSAICNVIVLYVGFVIEIWSCFSSFLLLSICLGVFS